MAFLSQINLFFLLFCFEYFFFIISRKDVKRIQVRNPGTCMCLLLHPQFCSFLLNLFKINYCLVIYGIMPLKIVSIFKSLFEKCVDLRVTVF